MNRSNIFSAFEGKRIQNRQTQKRHPKQQAISIRSRIANCSVLCVLNTCRMQWIIGNITKKCGVVWGWKGTWFRKQDKRSPGQNNLTICVFVSVSVCVSFEYSASIFFYYLGSCGDALGCTLCIYANTWQNSKRIKDNTEGKALLCTEFGIESIFAVCWMLHGSRIYLCRIKIRFQLNLIERSTNITLQTVCFARSAFHLWFMRNKTQTTWWKLIKTSVFSSIVWSLLFVGECV